MTDIESNNTISLVIDQTEPRILSREACVALVREVQNLAVDGGEAGISLDSKWNGNLRWARNKITSSGDLRTQDVTVQRYRKGTNGRVTTNQIHSKGLEAAVRRAEWILQRQHENPEADLWRTPTSLRSQHLKPEIWSEKTYEFRGDARASAARTLLAPALSIGYLAAGYIEVSAYSRAVMDGFGLALYYPWTQAQYSVTVREPSTRASGWAGQDHHDWFHIDPDALTATAIDKCSRSRNPVTIEPGRYTAILEPQAIGELFGSLFDRNLVRGPLPPMDRELNEAPLFKDRVPFFREAGRSKIGEQLLDPRISVTAAVMDSELGFPPFDRYGNIYRDAVWFDKGVLTNLAYGRTYANRVLNQEHELPNSGAFHMSGGTGSIDEMIATTRRGVLVTRFSNMRLIDPPSWLLTGFTRDGLWLVENGKITKAITNFRFTESPLFVLNQVEQLGLPQRIFHPDAPFVVPPVKVRDFSFTSLSDAV